jgi:transcriptional regulator with XRE-family HTH domain
MNKLVGEKLKELRKSRGIPLEDILQQLNISKSTYDRMERGETASWITKLKPICDLYQIEPEELLLPEGKYVLVNTKQKGGSTTLKGDIINNLSDKVIDLYERMLLEKDKKIEGLEKRVHK